MRAIPIYQIDKGQVICLPDDMAYQGVSEFEISRNGDVITLRPARSSWSSFSELPKADAEFLRERPAIVGDEDQKPSKQKRLGFLSGQGRVPNDFDRIDVKDHQLEQLERVASVSLLASEVLEDKDAAVAWLSRPNEALGGQVPILLCETEAGTKQVRRVLHALEWGGPA